MDGIACMLVGKEKDKNGKLDRLPPTSASYS